MSVFFHEQLYRSSETLARARACAVTVCGAGALGANVVESLARQGFARLRVIDRDRVEERNLSTQPYYRADIGARKAQMLANALYRALGVEVDARTDELTTTNAEQLLGESALVIDAFDNSGARQAVKDYCAAARMPCLHAGLAGDYAEVIWNESYRVPSPAQDDVCDYPLARNLVTLAVAVVCETVVNFVATGARDSYTITLRDLAVRPFELS
jgi:molybdopterin/thiamine biosynthesis adenylyltransferase